MTRSMVTQWGMSDRLGPIRYGEREDLVFLGREISEKRNYSDKVAQEIDGEVRHFVDEAHERCRQLLTEHWDKVELVAQSLLDVETINAEQFAALMRGENPFPEEEEPRGPKVKSSDQPGETARSDKRADSGLDIGGAVPTPA